MHVLMPASKISFTFAVLPNINMFDPGHRQENPLLSYWLNRTAPGVRETITRETFDGEKLDTIGELPAPPDLAILNVGAARLEAALTGAIEAGAKSAVIFDACHGENEAGQPVLQEIGRPLIINIIIYKL